MKQLIVLLIIVSVTAGYYLQHSNQIVGSDEIITSVLRTSKNDSFSLLTLLSTSSGEQETTEPQLFFDNNDLLNLPLAQLKSSIVLFWQQCYQAERCQQWLIEQKLKLPKQRYQLVSQYPENQKQLTLLLQYAQFDEDLSKKVATIKAAYQEIWGEQAHILFNEEFSFYDSRVELLELTEQAKLYQQDEILDMLDTLPQYNENNLTVKDRENKYSQAVELLSYQLDIEGKAQLRIKLAEHYFSPDKAQETKARQKQIIKQQQQVKNYQSELAILEFELAHKRTTVLANLTEPDWQTHRTQVIIEFRNNFFSQ